MSAITMAFDVTPDVAPPRGGPLDEPLVLFGIAVFGFLVVMVVWIRRRRTSRAAD